MPRRFLLVWTMFALVLSVQITGCSLFGYGIGTAIDSGRDIKTLPAQPSQVFELRPGAKLVVRMNDGTIIAGFYRGLSAEPESLYRQRYTAWRDTASPGFRPPRIGERVRIVTKGSQRAVFLGFGPRRLHYRGRARLGTFVAFDRIHSLVDSSGRTIPRDAIVKVADEIPVQTLAMIHGRRADHLVDLLDARITAIEFGLPHHGFRNAGLIIGITADATIIVLAAIIAAALSSEPSCSPSYSGSGEYVRRIPAPWPLPDSVYALPSSPLAANP